MTPTPLGAARAELVTSVDRHVVPDRNVVALLEGSDPKLRDELVIVCAHYDHNGTDGDRVFPGADDNGSGTVGMLEVAEAYALAAQAGRRPRRSVLFAAWNSEERGLLGAWAYTERPVRPLERTVAVLNLDMVGRNEEVPDGQGDTGRFRGLEVQTAASNANAINIIGTTRSADLKATMSRAADETRRRPWRGLGQPARRRGSPGGDGRRCRSRCPHLRSGAGVSRFGRKRSTAREPTRRGRRERRAAPGTALESLAVEGDRPHVAQAVRDHLNHRRGHGVGERREAVVDPEPASARFDQADATQVGEVPRRARLGNAQRFVNVAHAHLAAARKQAQDTEARAVGERLEQRLERRDVLHLTPRARGAATGKPTRRPRRPRGRADGLRADLPGVPAS